MGFHCLHSIPHPSFVFHPLLQPSTQMDTRASYLSPPGSRRLQRVLSFPAQRGRTLPPRGRGEKLEIVFTEMIGTHCDRSKFYNAGI